jgi:ABC-type transport system involved in multi-copper enzyme maturation permease subunit
VTAAFDDRVLHDRDRRRARLRRVGFYLRRYGGLVGVFLLSLVTLFVLVGFTEGRTSRVAFELPTTWLPRLASESDLRPIHRLTGIFLVLFTGGWLGYAGVEFVRRLVAADVWSRTPAAGMMAVARGAVEEAVRSRIVLLLLGILLVVVAVQPYLTLGNVEQPLRHRLQTFLSVASLSASLLLGATTALLACYATSNDLSPRRGGNVFVKPVSRGGYLVGKWLGVSLLMLAVTAAWATTVWGTSTRWIAQHEAIDVADAEAVRTRVLTARREVYARPGTPLEELARERFNEIARTDPDRVAQRGPQQLSLDLLNEQRLQFLSIPRGQEKEYIFPGLGAARAAADELSEQVRADAEPIAAQLRELGLEVTADDVTLESVAPYADLIGLDLGPALLELRFKAAGSNTYGSDRGQLLLSAAGRQVPVTYVIDRVQSFDIPATLVDENGELRMTLFNAGGADAQSESRMRSTLQFEGDVGLVLNARAGDFAPNLIRAAAVLWVRLAFVAMLGTVAGALLTFPVAATFTVVVWIIAAGGAWVRDVLATRMQGSSIAGVDAAFDFALLPLVRLLAALLAQFSDLAGMARVQAGLLISWNDLGRHLLVVGLLWTGLIFLVGWVLFRRREIARVQV